MTDSKTATELRGKLNKLIIELYHLDYMVDSPGSNITLGEYEQGREKMLDGFVQAIVATFGSGECEMETDWDYLNDGIPDAPEDTWAYKCSVCDWSFRYDRGIKPKFCPNCGKAVKR